MKSKFFEKIKGATIERQVEDVYNEGINRYFQPTYGIEYPYDCDGVVTLTKNNTVWLKLIIEYKLDKNMANKIERAKVLVQIIYYLKRFENNGAILPNVCLVGDKNQCFVIHTNNLLDYLDEQVDWNIAPSKASEKNPELVKKVASDENINPYIYDINETFSFQTVADEIKDKADNVQRYVRITEHNIDTIFKYFSKNIFKNTDKISAHDIVTIFIGVIIDNDNYYQHHNNKNILITPSAKIDIHGDRFESALSHFQRNYTPQEKTKFTEIADRLIEDTNRRKKGDFWTPTPFADYAHKRISEQFGADWKEKYVVWDNCCGSKNLTRDYYFNNLYCSTLIGAELEMSERYNKEAKSFQFDFLNDDLNKLPEQLLADLKANKPIIFLINPPYATAGIQGEDSKKGVAKTKINEQMLADNIGACSQNLYTQFLYRIELIKREFNLTDVNICLFSPTLFLSGSSYKKFRDVFFNSFKFEDAFQFKASYFANCADNWGISFSIWKSGETADKNNFNYDCIDLIEGEMQVVDTKVVYNLDGLTSASNWAKEPIKKLKTFDEPNVSSAIKVRPSNSDTRGKNFAGSYGYFNNGGNNVDKNTQQVALFSTAYGNGNGHGLNETNFTRCTALFSARKLVEKNWINSKDEYIAPNTDCAEWQEFENDSVVYSLFNNSSNQSSLRDVEYKGSKWNIKNEFFFMSKDEIKELANDNYLDEVFNDLRGSNERYVYSYLQNVKLSPEAHKVLNLAKELVAESFQYRGLFSQGHPEYQLDKVWDCGWYQIKAMIKECMPDRLKEFNTAYKELENKMLPMVYKVGFLK